MPPLGGHVQETLFPFVGGTIEQIRGCYILGVSKGRVLFKHACLLQVKQEAATASAVKAEPLQQQDTGGGPLQVSPEVLSRIKEEHPRLVVKCALSPPKQQQQHTIPGAFLPDHHNHPDARPICIKAQFCCREDDNEK